MITYRGEQLAVIPLLRPVAPTLQRFGSAGETTYTYQVVAVLSTGHTEASPVATITTGPDTLSQLHAIDIIPPYVQGAASYDIYRVSGGLSQGKIGSVTARNSGTIQGARFRDRGQVGDDTEPPTTNTTGLLVLSGLDEGSLVFVDADGGLRALAPSGTPGDVVTLVAGLPAWATAPGGSLAIGATITGLTQGSLLFGGTSEALAQDNVNLAYNATQTNLRLGPRPVSQNVYYYAPAWPTLVIAQDGDVAELSVQASGGNAAIVRGFSGQGDFTIPSASLNGDLLFEIVAEGIAPTNARRSAAGIDFGVDADPSGAILPGYIDFVTTNANGQSVRHMRITSQGTTALASPDAASTIVTAGQVEMQGDLLQSGAGRKVGLLGTVPVVQQAHIAAADLTNVHIRFNTLLNALEAYGLLATS